MTLTYKDAIARISHDLGVPGLVTYTQDWACELPEEYRTSNWIERYLAACRRSDYGSREKQILMDLVLDCINELVEMGDESGDRLWKVAEEVLRDGGNVYGEVVDDWAQEDEPLDAAQAIAPRLRELRATSQE